jgi:hypothetical protein
MVLAAQGCLQMKEDAPLASAPPVAGAEIGSANQNLGAQLGTQLGSQLGVQLGVQLGAQLGSQLGVQLGTQLGTQFGNQLGTQFGNQLGVQSGSIGADFLHSIVPLQIWDDCGTNMVRCPGFQNGSNGIFTTTGPRKTLFKVAGNNLPNDTIKIGTVPTTTGTTLAKIAGGNSLFGDTRAGSWHRWNLGPSFGDPSAYTDDMLSTAIFVNGACTFKALDYAQAQNGVLAPRTTPITYNIASRSRRLAELLQMTCGSSAALPTTMQNQTFWIASASPEMLNLININYATCILKDGSQWRLANENAADIARCNSQSELANGTAAWPRAGIANFVLKAMVFSLDMPIVVAWRHIDGTTKAYWYGGDENDSRMNGAAAFSRLDVKPKSAATTATEKSLIHGWNIAYLILHQIVNTQVRAISPRMLDNVGGSHVLSTHSDAYDNATTLAIAQNPSRYVQFQPGPMTVLYQTYDGVAWVFQAVESFSDARQYYNAIGAYPITTGPVNNGVICPYSYQYCVEYENNGDVIYFGPSFFAGWLAAGPKINDSGAIIGQRKTLILAATDLWGADVTTESGEVYKDNGEWGEIPIYTMLNLAGKYSNGLMLGINWASLALDSETFGYGNATMSIGSLTNYDRVMMSYTPSEGGCSYGGC